MRIRIALGTAVAVLALPAMFFAVFSSSSAASARLIRHEAISHQRGVKVDSKLMSFAQAEYAAKLATYTHAVEVGQEETYLAEVAYLKTVAYLKAVAAQRQQQAAQAATSAAAATAATPVAPVQAVPAATPTPAGSSDATSVNTADWACIRQHESSDNYTAGNGGAYQFQFGTWNGLTGLPSPAEDYPPAVQDAAALTLYSQRGWEPWTTRIACGL